MSDSETRTAVGASTAQAPAQTNEYAPTPTSEDVSVGKPLTRLDGRLKVTGTAPFSAEFPLPGLL